MARGKKTPTAIKKLQGSGNVTRDGGKADLTIKPLEKIPPPPSYFGPVAVREWNELLPMLKAAKVLEAVDLPQLRMYCHAIQMAEDAADQLKNGYTDQITNKGGHTYDVPSPMLKVLNDANQVIIKVASKFGFDPVARMKVVATGKEKQAKDPFEEALDGNVKMKVAK